MNMTDKQVENFIVQNANYFCSPEHQMLYHVPKKGQPSEGEDGNGFSIDGMGGHIEVKAIHHFLRRGNDNADPTGSLPFEVFLLQKQKDIEEATKDGRDPDFPGWLFALFNQLVYMDKKTEAGYNRTSASSFNKLAFGLKDENEALYACIMFEDIPRLRRCIEMLLPPIVNGEWDISNIVIPARNDSYWRKYKRWEKNFGAMILNNWHIPFARILHLATVTMIDDDPVILPDHNNDYNQWITAEMQTQRLDTLKQLAIYPDGSERRVSIEDIGKTDPRHSFFDFSGIPEFNPNNPEHIMIKAKKIFPLE